MTVFGLQWTQATDAYVRPAGSTLTHLAVTSPTNAETLAAVAQASTYAPWSGMRRCNLWDDGTPTAYYGDRCYTDTDVANMGQAMVQIPKFWYTTDHGGGVYKWYISTDGNAGDLPAGADHAWAVHPAFIRDGVTKNYIYVGAYEGYLSGTTSKLESKSLVIPTCSKTIAQSRTAAQLRGTGWQVQDYLTTSAVQLLYLVEYGGFNAQVLLSVGITNLAGETHRSTPCLTGHTTTLGNTSGGVGFATDTANGLVAPDGTTATQAASYRGIENPYGNTHKFIDGINIKADRNPWVADHDFVSDTFAHPYVDTGLTLFTTSGAYAGDITTNATYDYGFSVGAVGGTADTKLCDHAVNGEGNKMIVYGGAYADGTPAGMFCSHCEFASNFTYLSIGCGHLMYIG